MSIPKACFFTKDEIRRKCINALVIDYISLIDPYVTIHMHILKDGGSPNILTKALEKLKFCFSSKDQQVAQVSPQEQRSSRSSQASHTQVEFLKPEFSQASQVSLSQTELCMKYEPNALYDHSPQNIENGIIRFVEATMKSSKVKKEVAKQWPRPAPMKQTSLWQLLDKEEKNLFVQCLSLIKNEELAKKLKVAVKNVSHPLQSWRDFMLLFIQTFKNEELVMSNMMMILIGSLPEDIMRHVLSLQTDQSGAGKSPYAITFNHLCTAYNIGPYARGGEGKGCMRDLEGRLLHLMEMRPQPLTLYDLPTIIAVSSPSKPDTITDRLFRIAAPKIFNYKYHWDYYPPYIRFYLSDTSHKLNLQLFQLKPKGSSEVTQICLEAQYSPVGVEKGTLRPKFIMKDGMFIRKICYSRIINETQPNPNFLVYLRDMIDMVLFQKKFEKRDDTHMYMVLDTRNFNGDFDNHLVYDPLPVVDEDLYQIIDTTAKSFIDGLFREGGMYSTFNDNVKEYKPRQEHLHFESVSDIDDDPDLEFEEEDEDDEDVEEMRVDMLFDKTTRKYIKQAPKQIEIAMLDKKNGPKKVEKIIKTIAERLLDIQQRGGYISSMWSKYLSLYLNTYKLADDLKERIIQDTFNLVRCYEGTGNTILKAYRFHNERYDEMIKVLFPPSSRSTLGGGRVKKSSLSTKTRVELISFGKSLGIKGLTSLTKDEIITKINRETSKSKKRVGKTRKV